MVWAPPSRFLILTSILLLLNSANNLLWIEAAGEGETKAEKQCLAFGIDLGTTFSALAFCHDGKCNVIPNEFGNSITPSVIAYDENSGVFKEVGEPADQLADEHPASTVRQAKNFVGRKYAEIVDEAKNVPYKVIGDKNGMAALQIGDKTIPFSQVSSEVLKKFDQLAQNYLKMIPNDGSEIDIKYVITVPAYFNQPKRKATKDAALYAGIDVLSLISEPVAATLTMPSNELSTNLVVDIGGGTTDITVQHVEDGVYITKSTTGDLHLGGVNFDRLIANELKKKAKLSQVDEAKLLKVAEGVKITLSTEEIAETDYGIITRYRFNQLMEEYVTKVNKLIHEAIKNSDYKLDDIDHILLVGGSARVPIFKDRIEREFSKKVIVSSNPDHAIALGAAQLAAQMCGHGPEDKVMITTVAHGYAVKAQQGAQEVAVFIVDPNTNVPTTLSQTFSTAADNQPEVEVKILQGFDKNVSKNEEIGSIRYQGLPLKRAGQVQVDVEFSISEDQIMTARVTGKYPGAETKELTLSLDDKIEAEEIERRKKEAKEQADLFNYILEVENKLNDARYAIESSITRDSVEDAHKKFVKELLQKWDQAKAKFTNADSLKAEFDPKIEKAAPILEKISEAKVEALKKHDEKNPDAASQPSSSSASPEDL